MVNSTGTISPRVYAKMGGILYLLIVLGGILIPMAVDVGLVVPGDPAYAEKIGMVLVVALIGELSFCLWLLVKGVNISEWRKRVVEST